jgi:hypothetical protein
MLSNAKTTEELRLAEAVELIAYCAVAIAATRRGASISPSSANRLGPRFLVGDIRPRLRCSTCGSRNIIVVTLWQSASSTSSMTAHWK